MASCELCGSESNSLSTNLIAGSKMQVCRNCSSHGKNVEEGPKSHNFYRKKKSFDLVEDLVPNYASLISSTIAKKNLSVEHLAKGTNIKVSEMHQYLSQKIKPDNNIAKRIGNFLQIKLVDEVEQGETLINEESDNSTSTLTLGDLLKKQMEKKNND